MKKLPTPTHNDAECTNNASQNRRMCSFPYLQNELEVIIQAYINYQNALGNVLTVAPAMISDELSTGLKNHYKSEPVCFSFISELRDSSRRVCPMCGSLGTGTIDHLFPQARFPEFAVFSKNLVPACNCNSKRKDAYKGVDVNLGSDVRVLHPYYDDCLSNRQISFLIEPQPEYPLAKFSLIYLNQDDAIHQSIKFHVEKIVIPSGIIKEMEDKWASLSEYPSDKIQTLPEFELIDLASLNEALDSALRRHDRQKGTPNNWESIFVHSISNSISAKEWIVEKHNQVVNGIKGNPGGVSLQRN